MQFTEAVNTVLQLNRQNLVEFIAPFVELHKEDELRIAKELTDIYNYDILEDTWSCYNGYSEENNFKECGHCNTCTEKLTGYIQAGYEDYQILGTFNVTQEELNRYRKDVS